MARHRLTDGQRAVVLRAGRLAREAAGSAEYTIGHVGPAGYKADELGKAIEALTTASMMLLGVRMELASQVYSMRLAASDQAGGEAVLP